MARDYFGQTPVTDGLLGSQITTRDQSLETLHMLGINWPIEIQACELHLLSMDQLADSAKVGNYKFNPGHQE